MLLKNVIHVIAKIALGTFATFAGARCSKHYRAVAVLSTGVTFVIAIVAVCSGVSSVY